MKFKTKKAHIGTIIAVLCVLMLFFAIFLEPSFFKGIMMGLYIAAICVCTLILIEVWVQEEKKDEKITQKNS